MLVSKLKHLGMHMRGLSAKTGEMKKLIHVCISPALAERPPLSEKL